MILLIAAAQALPGLPNLTDEDVREGARLVNDSATREGDVENYVVDLRLRNQAPELSIRNDGETALVVDWSTSEIAPPNAERTGLRVGPGRTPEDREISTIEPGRTLTVGPIPAAWVDDGEENDDAQWATWTETSFTTLVLAVERSRKKGTHTSEWHTDFDQEFLKAKDLEKAAVKAAKETEPTTVTASDNDLLVSQTDWDRRQRGLRIQARTARPIWITSGSVGAVTGLLTGMIGLSIASAPEEARIPGELTKDEYRGAALFYGAITGAALTIAVPTFIWDRSARKKARELGPRPLPTAP